MQGDQLTGVYFDTVSISSWNFVSYGRRYAGSLFLTSHELHVSGAFFDCTIDVTEDDPVEGRTVATFSWFASVWKSN